MPQTDNLPPPKPSKTETEQLFAEFFFGFTISVVPNKLMQKGKGVLMVHPDDMPEKSKIEKVNTNGK